MSERGQGGLLCQGVTPRRDRGIDSGERGQAFGRGYGGKLGGHCCHPRDVMLRFGETQRKSRGGLRPNSPWTGNGAERTSARSNSSRAAVMTVRPPRRGRR